MSAGQKEVTTYLVQPEKRIFDSMGMAAIDEKGEQVGQGGQIGQGGQVGQGGHARKGGRVGKGTDPILFDDEKKQSYPQQLKDLVDSEVEEELKLVCLIFVLLIIFIISDL